MNKKVLLAAAGAAVLWAGASAMRVSAAEEGDELQNSLEICETAEFSAIEEGTGTLKAEESESDTEIDLELDQIAESETEPAFVLAEPALTGTVVKNASEVKNVQSGYVAEYVNGSTASTLASVYSAAQSQGLLTAQVWQVQGTGALAEAHTFFSLVQPYVGKNVLFMLDCNKVLPGAGTAYIKDVDEYFYRESGCRPVLASKYADSTAVDWNLTQGNKVVSSVQNAGLTASAWKTAAKKTGTQTYTPQVTNRLYNPNSGEHFFTVNEYEAVSLNRLGWNREGLSWTAPASSSLPVYRLYNPNAGDHHYTTSRAERDYLVRVGWKNENVGWNASASNTGMHDFAVYRLYNPNAKSGAHHFTTDKNEYEALGKLGWRKEGIAWYTDLPISTGKAANYVRSDGSTVIGYNGSGAALSGIQKVGTKSYAFESGTGKRIDKTGLVTIGSAQYYMNSDHSLAAGLLRLTNKNCFFSKSTFQMLKNQFVYVPGSGYMYFDGSGNRVSGNQTIAGKTWTFSQNGILVSDIIQQDLLRTANGSFQDVHSAYKVPILTYMLTKVPEGRARSLISTAFQYVGYPYVWGGKSPQTSFDCSGLVTWIMKNVLGYAIDPMMTSAAALSGWCTLIDGAQAQPGDLVFWKTSASAPNYDIEHVEIFVGDGWTYGSTPPEAGIHPTFTTLSSRGGRFLFGRLR